MQEVFNQFQSLLTEQYDKESEHILKEYTGSTLDEALGNAYLDLNIPVKSLRFEVKEKGRRGIMGFFAKDWVVLIIRKRTLLNNLSSKSKRGSDDIGKDKLPYYSLAIDKRGAIKLRIFSVPKNEKEAVLEEIFGKIEMRTSAYIDKEKVYDSVYNDISDSVVLGTIRLDETKNARILEIQINENKTQVHIRIQGPGRDGADLTRDAILEALDAENVVFGFLEMQLEKFSIKPIYNEPFLVAQGIEAIHEDAGVIKYYFFDEYNDDMNDTRIDFKERNATVSVKEGTLLAQIVETTRGIDGQNVHGESLPYEIKTDKVQLFPGENTKLSSMGDMLYAAKDGRPMFDDQNNVMIEDIIHIKGDVGPKTGNIHAEVTVIVDGSVLSGYKVVSEGDIIIQGGVGYSYLYAEKNILIANGINAGLSYASKYKNLVKSKGLDAVPHLVEANVLSDKIFQCIDMNVELKALEVDVVKDLELGTEEQEHISADFHSVIEAKGDLKTGHINNAQVFVGGCAVFNRALNSDIYVGDSLISSKDSAVLLGGLIVVKNDILLGTIGNQMELKSYIITGEDPKHYYHLHLLTLLLDEFLDPKCSRLKKDVGFLKKQLNNSSKNSSKEKFERLQKDTKKLEILETVCLEVRSKKENLAKKIRVSSNPSAKIFAKTTFANAHIEICGVKLAITREYSGDFITFSSDKELIDMDLSGKLTDGLLEKEQSVESKF